MTEVTKPKRAEGRNGGQLNRAGRPKGVPNKLNRDIRQMVRKAMSLAETEMRNRELMKDGVAKKDLPKEDADPVDYLKRQAIENSTAFMGMVKGLMPKQIDIELSLTGEDLTATLQHRRDRLAERSARATLINEETEDAEIIPPDPQPDPEPVPRRRRRPRAGSDD